MIPAPFTQYRQHGFTLVEMAVVLAIVALLLGGLIVPLSAQVDLQKTRDTRKALAETREVLLGFAAANGRLPCPASSTSNGAESFAAGGSAANGNCSNFFDGFIPAATLGLTPVDAQGYMLDGWNNRVRYAVSNATVNGVANPFTSTGGIKAATMSSIASASLLYVCASATGTTTTCGTAITLTSQAPVVILSTGKNGAAGSSGLDESHNTDNDSLFISHDIAPAGAVNGEFDDIVTWLSTGGLLNRMLTAGQLP